MRAPSSFRLKLQVAMMLVVAAATGATLLVLQQSVEATYRHIAEERFASAEEFALAQLDANQFAIPYGKDGLDRLARGRLLEPRAEVIECPRPH